MTYIVDTHALIWFLANDKNLGKDALHILRLADNSEEIVIIPTIVLAEVFYICEKKKVNLEFNSILDKIGDSSNYIVYDLDLEVILKLKDLNKIRELHDRIIIATALLTNSKILTKDVDIRASNYVSVVW